MRRLHKLYAWLLGYFWLPCPVCGREFGGHEPGTGRVSTDDPGTFHIACNLHNVPSKK